MNRCKLYRSGKNLGIDMFENCVRNKKNVENKISEMANHSIFIKVKVSYGNIMVL